MGTNWHYTGAGPTIETSLFNRTNTNSISCQGAFNISEVMASAVWAVAYVLYLSSLKVSRVNFHMGTRYRYSPW